MEYDVLVSSDALVGRHVLKPHRPLLSQTCQVSASLPGPSSWATLPFKEKMSRL